MRVNRLAWLARCATLAICACALTLSSMGSMASMASMASMSRAQPASPSGVKPAASAGSPVYVVPLRGAVGPATAHFVTHGIEQARRAGAQLVVIEMDTPGGLDRSMRDIIQAILASPVPVATFVSPSGARAASAGAYILYASHIAAMAPGTNVGAASPVSIGIGGPRGGDHGARGDRDASAPAGGSGEDTMTRKQMHDAAAYIRGLAQLRQRNAEWAERAVREAVSLPASEAVDQHVADLMAPDLPALLRQLDGREVEAAGAQRVLRTADAPVVATEPDWRARLLAVITDPSVALILMMIGIYALIFEFSTPGMVAPGIVGAICLLLGLFALQMLLPLNYAGLALVALGIGCMVAEIFLPTLGVLGVGGAVAFAIGAVMLIDTDVPGFGIPLSIIAMLALASVAFMFLMSALVLRTRRRPVVSGGDTIVGRTGLVIADAKVGDDGWASVGGEQWRVRSGTPLARGQSVRVTARDGLVLDVVAID
ncbi:NfeD family protein [Cupriavidus plantarum]|uniref:NfeD family protein n=1 Tax=Cupriavidus plantarum TaxID=942865 RepID=UPI000E3A5EE9|nr:membrane-bound serine protease (ClpP class) [Cupriavidus plantarum]